MEHFSCRCCCCRRTIPTKPIDCERHLRSSAIYDSGRRQNDKRRSLRDAFETRPLRSTVALVGLFFWPSGIRNAQGHSAEHFPAKSSSWNCSDGFFSTEDSGLGRNWRANGCGLFLLDVVEVIDGGRFAETGNDEGARRAVDAGAPVQRRRRRRRRVVMRRAVVAGRAWMLSIDAEHQQAEYGQI